MQAGTLNCPSCGASVSSDSTQCLYCHSLLQTVACPSCYGLMFQGTRHCPHCGTLAQAPRVQPSTVHACPRCQGEMKALSLQQTPLEQCCRCGGLWIDTATFDRICADRQAQAAALGLNVPAPASLEPEVRYLKCPQCAALMNRVSYAHRSGVVIDICRSHGIWLDRDELRRIIEFIRAGGLDRARRLEIERLQRERQQLEVERRTPLYAGNVPYTDNSADEDSPSLIAAALNWLFR